MREKAKTPCNSEKYLNLPLKKHKKMDEITSEKPVQKKKNWKKILLIILGIFLLLILATPFLLDIYLKKKLPSLVNEKTPYTLQLQDFDLSLFSGDVVAKDIRIQTKNPKDSTITQINGHVKSLNVAGIGIWNAIFNKTYGAKNIEIANPDLAIVLGPEKKEKKKKISFNLENILVTNGQVSVKKNNGVDLFKGKNVNIKLTDIQQSEDSAKIPLAFKEFKIDAADVVVTANEFYQVLATKIEAKNKTLDISQFHLKPIESPKLYNAKNVFDLKVDHLAAENFTVSSDSLIVENTVFSKPNLQVISTNKKTVKKENPKEINLKIGLKNISFEQGKVLVLNHNKAKTAEVENFNFKLSDIVFDKNTVKEKIPFHFSDHNIEAENIYFKNNDLQAVKISKIFTNDQNITVDGFHYVALGRSRHKDVFDIKTKKILIKNNQSKYIGQELNLKFQDIEVIEPNVKLYAAANKPKTKTKKSAPAPNLKAVLAALTIKNGKFSQISNGKEKMSVGKFNIQLNGISTDKKILAEAIPVHIKSRLVTAEKIYLDAGKYYTLKVGSLKNTGKQTDIHTLHYLPKYSRAGFSRVIPKQMDLYTIKVKEVNITDHQTKFGKDPSIYLDKVVLNGIDCNIYHDLAPPEDHAIRYLFGKKLRNIKMPLFVKNVEIKNSTLAYEENAENANIPGKITFERFNAKINNVNNAKMKGMPTLVNVDGTFAFYGKAPTVVNWNFDVANPNDEFKIVGKVTDLSVDNVNLFVRPYLNVTLDGKIDYLKFDYYGDNSGIYGKFFFRYNDMYVNFLNKKNGKERKLLSTVANWFVKNDSQGEPEHVVIKKKRDPEKSFFNMLWQGIMEGLKKYVI